MKRPVIFILTIAITLILSACGGGKEAKKEESKPEPAKITAKPDITQTAKSKNYAPPANLKTVRIDTTTQIPKPTAETSKTTPTTPDTAAVISSQQKIGQSTTATPPEAGSAVSKTESIAIAETTDVVHPCPKSAKSEEPMNTLRSYLFFDDIFFDANETNTPSLTFNSNYVITLSKVVKALKSDPKLNVRLKGHTMNLGTKPEKDKDISLRRAITVGKLIFDLFPADKKESIAYRIEIVPVGSDEMLIEGDNRVKELLNHRVSIELFDGNLVGSTLADFIHGSKLAKPTVASSAPKKLKKPVPKVTLSRATTQDIIYSNGQKLFNQKNYPEAISTFEELVSLNPQHSLADNAQWWIGECYYFQGDFVSALNAYQKVFELGDRNKSAYAQLRLGYCYDKLNQADLARSAWEMVIRDYPNAVEEVTKAQKVLQITSTK